MAASDGIDAYKGLTLEQRRGRIFKGVRADTIETYEQEMSVSCGVIMQKDVNVQHSW